MNKVIRREYTHEYGMAIEVDGDYVLYDDYEELQAELYAYKAHVKLLGGFVTKVRSENTKRIGWHIDPEASFCSTMARECTKILAKTPAQSLRTIQAQAVTDLISECSYSGVVDGVATSIIDVDRAIKYADRLKGEG